MTKSRIKPVLDPRGYQERPLLQLAPRVSMDDLRKGPILLYDNIKLDFANYREIYTRIKRNFSEEGINNFVEFRETVRGKTDQDLKNFARRLAAANPVAAILALGDMGASPATTILAIGLEKLGIPSVFITAPPGTDLVKGVAFYRAGQLCIISLDIYQGSTIEEIDKKVDEQMTGIYEALTLPFDHIGKLASLHFKVDAVAPLESGFLELSDKIDLNNLDLSEPAAGIETITNLFNDLHLGDGLPIVPPTEARFERMMTYCPFDPDMVLAREIGPSGKDITVKNLAVCAVMAGCQPQAMPILITAFRAMSNKKYNFLQSVTTSHPGGNLLLVSGPLAQEVGLHGGAGCLGPGFPANMTIGRAVNLVLINICRSIPGHADLACISSQAEIAYCFCEDPELTPWLTINAERYDDQTTTVYTLKAEPPHDIIDFLSQTAGDLLDGIVDSCTTLGSNNAYIPGPLVIVLTRDHAWLLAREGWDKDSIREHIHANTHHPVAMVKNRGLVPVRPASFEDRHPMPVTREARDIEIVVAGGRGGHSAVILPWALHSEGIVEPVVLPNGSPAKSLEEFRARN
jgi:hypothetical protein